MTAPTWKTRDGRVYEIAWMNSRHLVNTFNLIMRNNSLTKSSIQASGIPPGELRNLADEIKARSLWDWTDEMGHESTTQLHRPIAEGFEQICMTRAMLDSNVFWPTIVFKFVAVQLIRTSFDSIQTSIEQALADAREPNRAALERLVAKYTEYRLAPRRNDW